MNETSLTIGDLQFQFKKLEIAIVTLQTSVRELNNRLSFLPPLPPVEFWTDDKTLSEGDLVFDLGLPKKDHDLVRFGPCAHGHHLCWILDPKQYTTIQYWDIVRLMEEIAGFSKTFKIGRTVVLDEKKA